MPSQQVSAVASSTVRHSIPVGRILTFMTMGVTIVLFIAAVFTSTSLHAGELHYNSFVWIPGISLLVASGLLFVVLRKPTQSEETMWLLVYILLSLIICAAQVMQILSNSPAAAAFWYVNFVPAGLLSPVLLLFALTYTNRTAQRFNGLEAFVIVCGLIYIFFSLVVNPNTIDENVFRLISRQPWGWDVQTLAPTTWLLNLIPYIWVLGSAWVAIARLLSFRRHTQNVILKRQSLVFIFAVAVPIILGVVVSNVLNVFPSFSHPSMNGPIAVLTSVILVFGIYRYRLLTISPTQFSEVILDLMQESVIVINEQFEVIYRNPTAELLIGSAGSNATLTVSQILTPDSMTNLKTARATAPPSGVFTIDRLDVTHLQAHLTPVRLTSSPLQLTGFDASVLVLTDITDEVETQKVIEHEVTVRTRELHQARAYLLASISSLQQGFLLVNAQGQVELSNHRAAVLLHISEGQVAGQALVNISSSLQWDKNIIPVVERGLKHKTTQVFETAAADGSFYTVYITPVILEGQTLGVTIVIEDQTEQKVLERSKDEFFSIASHELRTPLTAIRGNMSMAQDYFGEALKDPSLHELVADTHTASVRLIEIVNDFLDSSKLEQGKMVFTFASVAVIPLVTAVLADLQTLIKQQGNQIVFDASLQQLPLITADEGRLRQILYNLMSNANKYCEHGTITISGSVAGDDATIHIIDTGKGISLENQKLLFHKFLQAGDNILTRDNTKGTGLGLYISKLLANNMRGDVKLEYSEENKATSFIVTLPRAKKTNES